MDESATTRVTVEEAARLLGIEKASVKKRVQRGKLRSERDASGTLWVWVDPSETVQDGSETEAGTVRDELVETLRDEVTHLRRESERKDTIIMSLSQSNAEMSRTIRALEAPAQSPDPAEANEEAAQEPAEGAAGVRPTPSGAGTPAASQPGTAQRVAENTAGSAAGQLIATAILVYGASSWKIITSVVVALFSFVAAYLTSLSGLDILSWVFQGFGLLASVVSVFFLLRLGGRVRRALEEADDTVAEAADEELMRQEAQERERRLREAVARGEERPF